jgi:hypothetical protein
MSTKHGGNIDSELRMSKSGHPFGKFDIASTVDRRNFS